MSRLAINYEQRQRNTTRYGDLPVGCLFRSYCPTDERNPCIYIKSAQGAISLRSGASCNIAYETEIIPVKGTLTCSDA